MVSSACSALHFTLELFEPILFSLVV
jgi:hypothetical protein